MTPLHNRGKTLAAAVTGAEHTEHVKGLPAQFAVTPKAMRPAGGSARQCFYCHEPIGGLHKGDCVLVHKKVRVRLTVEYEVEVPHAWTGEQVEFHRNESSWCKDNLLPELDALSDAQGCLCSVPGLKFKYLVDASGPYRGEE